MGGLSAHSLLASLLLTQWSCASFWQLNLSGNCLCGVWDDDNGRQHGDYTSEGINAIADALRVNGGLTSIDLSRSQLCGIWTDDDGDQYGTYTAEGITAIADALRVNGGLTKISLAKNKLGEEGTKAICEALEQNKTLKELDISGGTYGNINIGCTAGAKHVAKMLGVNSALTSVEFRGNKLGDKGWGAIFAAICGNKDSKIMSMDASSENIGPVGVKLIAEALRTSVTGGLTSINMSNNYLTHSGTDMTGIKELAAALGVNCSLTKIE
jgi:hypothetical protein